MQTMTQTSLDSLLTADQILSLSMVKQLLLKMCCLNFTWTFPPLFRKPIALDSRVCVFTMCFLSLSDADYQKLKTELAQYGYYADCLTYGVEATRANAGVIFRHETYNSEDELRAFEEMQTYDE